VKTMKLNLLPTPRKLVETGGAVSVSELSLQEIIDPSLLSLEGDEAYSLEVKPGVAMITARTEKGLRWGRATWQQLSRYKEIPCLSIEDAPRFNERGLMLDISRNRIPTMETLFDLVDKMAEWKMNHLQLYVEHSIAYSGHENVWRSVSPLSLEEVKSLDLYCRNNGVYLHANQNSLGHFEKWLRHPEYSHLAESVRGSRAVPHNFYRPPNTLCPLDPGVHRLIDDLFHQLLPLCSGQYANIGCDEPWDLGRGRSREVCEKKGRAAVFSEYVTRVAREAQKYGKKPQFWCDPHPNEDDGLPKDITALIWEYESTGNFSQRMASHRKQGREVWVAPGTSCHCGFTGRTWNRRANLQMATKEKEVSGMLCTSWGDAGHRQAWPLSLLGFAEAAQASWAGHLNVSDEVLGTHAFGSAATGGWLARLGNVDQELCRGEKPAWGKDTPDDHLFNRTALWQEMHTPLHLASGRGDVASWEEVGERLQALQQDLSKIADTPYSKECAWSLQISQWTVKRAIAKRTGKLTAEMKTQLVDEMVDRIHEFRINWLARFRYGELEDTMHRFLRLVEELDS